MKNIEKVTNNMKIVYSILCNLKKCTIFELQKMTKFRDVDLCLALGYLLQNNQIYRLCKLNCVMLYSHSISSVG
ncbi:winged helix-turn-helix domain-containing protein, partial [uncultured Bacteroides sp.]|uniref:winged helix-turn-helix domain-containing protein n=1 Tax=uncultured Bacteroides sp. TaxID=162156 RepID=UPI00280B5765